MNEPISIIQNVRKKIAFIGDTLVFVGDTAKKKFIQIDIREQDQNVQKFLWGKKQQKTSDIYTMMVIIFGALFSPCSAQSVKNRNHIEFASEFLETTNTILNKHYM